MTNRKMQLTTGIPLKSQKLQLVAVKPMIPFHPTKRLLCQN